MRRCNSCLCENNFSGSEKLFFSQCLWQEMEYHAQVQNEFSCTSLCGIGDQSCKSPLSPENQWSNELDKKQFFRFPKIVCFFFRFSVLIDPWWNEIVLCEKTIFWNPKNCFFNTCLHSLQPSQNHSKSIFGNLNNCFAPIT